MKDSIQMPLIAVVKHILQDPNHHFIVQPWYTEWDGEGRRLFQAQIFETEQVRTGESRSDGRAQKQQHPRPLADSLGPFDGP